MWIQRRVGTQLSPTVAVNRVHCPSATNPVVCEPGVYSCGMPWLVVVAQQLSAEPVNLTLSDRNGPPRQDLRMKQNDGSACKKVARKTALSSER